MTIYMELTDLSIEVRAHDVARAWLNTFLAAGDDANRPVLNRTVCIEWYEDTGLQLIGCDGTMLFRSWIPKIPIDDEKVAPWPEKGARPTAKLIVMDIEGFAIAFMRSLLRVTSDDDRRYEPLTLSLVDQDGGATLALGEEFMKQRVVLRACGQRIDLKLYEDKYPDWRNARLGTDDVERVDGIRISPELFKTVGQLKGVTAIDLEFYGDRKHVAFVATGETQVRGLLMPMRREKTEDA